MPNAIITQADVDDVAEDRMLMAWDDDGMVGKIDFAPDGGYNWSAVIADGEIARGWASTDKFASAAISGVRAALKEANDA